MAVIGVNGVVFTDSVPDHVVVGNQAVLCFDVVAQEWWHWHLGAWQNLGSAAGTTWHVSEAEPDTENGADGDFNLDGDGNVWVKTSGEWAETGINLKGSDGADGADGADGTKWWIGDGVPGPEIGEPNDFYLDRETGDYYQKIGGEGDYVYQGSLQGSPGADGNNGSDGATWYTGSGSPSGGTGGVSDLYLDTSNGDYYLKTGASTWTLQGNLQGAPGNDGNDGSDGANGTTWYTDSGEPYTGLGLVNDLYLDDENGNFYLKTGDTTWTLQGTLRGAAGADGSDGATWYTGSGVPADGTGIENDLYLNTSNNEYYLKTGPSTWTLQGDLTGATGSNGTNGEDGATWHTGSGAPSSGLGAVNDFYLDDVDGKYYLKTDTSTWTEQGSLIGPGGPAGDKGADGEAIVVVEVTTSEAYVIEAANTCYWVTGDCSDVSFHHSLGAASIGKRVEVVNGKGIGDIDLAFTGYSLINAGIPTVGLVVTLGSNDSISVRFLNATTVVILSANMA